MSNDETKKKLFFKNDLKKRPNLNQVNFQN
jgi:hypothetical protein